MSILRSLTLATVATFAASLASAEDGATKIAVMKSPTCGCCNAWIDHLEENGFEVEATNLSGDALDRFKADRGIAPQHQSCHTGIVDGYVIEGHVPASDIVAFLKGKPKALGLSVPGMPLGSPGMEMGDRHDAYDVLMLEADGDTQVFSSYEAK